MKLNKNFYFISLFLLMNSELFNEEGYYLSHDNFKIIKKLDVKTYFSEYKVYNKDDDNLYIIKKINIKGITPKEIETLKEKFEKISDINSEFIIKYYDYFIEDDTFNIVMEYIDGMNLKEFIELYRNSDSLIKREFILSFIYHISLGLQVIHKNHIIHGEIDPENIFITNDYKIKIGGFEIINKTNFQNIEDKTQISAPIYTAPEVNKGLNYDYKIDIWSFGCIIYELCTLKNFTKNKTINSVKYGEKFQNIIDLTLRKKPEKRPSAEEILQILDDEKSEIFDLYKNFTMDKLIRNDPILEKYLLEKAMFNILDKELLEMLGNTFSEYIKELFDIIWTFLSNLINEIISYFKSFQRIKGKLTLTLGKFLGFKDKDKFNKDKFIKDIFIKDNLKIVRIIMSDLSVKIFTFMNKKMTVEKTINIYNIKTFEKKTNLIEKELTSYKFIKKLKRKIIKKFNILLLGNTNVGKSTLINEFLKLSKNERAKESTGGPTKTKDFKQYNGSYNDVAYSLFDTNGITNKGENSIENKVKNTEKEIIKRNKSKDPNQLIHCIWYCFQGTNIQPSDGEFIKKLINIYDKYSIPIIFVHTQTYSIGQSNICKKGIKKYLREIFVKEEDVESHLNNYVNILARGDNKIGDEEEEEDNTNNIKDCLNNDIEPFGLDKLEEISRKEIIAKGLKSSYYEYIKEEIKPIIINAAFRLFFTENNLNVLAKTAITDLKNYINIILELFDDEQLNLSKMIKERNKKILNNLYESFQKIKENIKDNFVDYLTVENLKKNYDKNIEKLFDFKSENYKKSMDYQTFCEKIEKIIYNKLNKNSKKILDVLVNLSFNNYIIENIKLGIEEHFSDREEKIINKIYEDIFESLDFNNASK